MKKLAMYRRMEIYLKAVEFIKNHIKKYGHYRYGLCYVLDEFYDLECYPEIYRHKPKKYRMFWFPCDSKGTAKRLEILNEAIKEIQGKLKKNKKKYLTN